MKKVPSVIIIGAGVGGIASAIHLARHGMKVTVFEKNQRPGGRCDYFVRDGHYFDTGPTLLIMPLVYEAEFAALGLNLHEKLKLQRVDPSYHLVFDDGNQLALTGDMRLMYEQLEKIEAGSFQGFLRYLEEGDRHYRLAMEHLVLRDFQQAKDFFKLSSLPLIYSVKPLIPHYFNMQNYFKTDRLKAAFSFQDVYMGLSPFVAPATFSMMPYAELAHGVWYPKGGMKSLIDVLMETARELGVQFEFNNAVKKIEVKDSIARSVLLVDRQCVSADIIVANADLPYVYQELLPDEKEAQRLYQKQYSCSVISFFWGLNKSYPSLGPHTLFLADDLRENFDAISKRLSLAAKPSLYTHAPARLNPSAAPENEDTVIAVVPVGHLDERGGQDWQALRQQARQSVFDRLKLLGINDLDSHIKFEVSYTPLSWHKRYNLVKGSTHGLSHTLIQLAYFRPHNQHKHYHNLYFVGASTHPGTGLPTTLISARLLANRIINNLD